MKVVVVMKIVMLKADAIRVAGKPARLAKALDISRSAVHQWGNYVPSDSASRLLQSFPDIPHQKLDENGEEIQAA